MKWILWITLFLTVGCDSRVRVGVVPQDVQIFVVDSVCQIYQKQDVYTRPPEDTVLTFVANDMSFSSGDVIFKTNGEYQRVRLERKANHKEDSRLWAFVPVNMTKNLQVVIVHAVTETDEGYRVTLKGVPSKTFFISKEKENGLRSGTILIKDENDRLERGYFWQ